MTTLTNTVRIDTDQNPYAGIPPEMEYSFAALYRITYAIAATQSVDRTAIKPDSRLETFFPRKDREQNIKRFQSALGVEVDLLVMKDSWEWAVIVSAAASLITLFFAWHLAMTCLGLTIIVGCLAGKFGRELKPVSVQQLAEDIAREHYIKARNYHAAFNKMEAIQMPEQSPVHELELEQAV